MRVRTTTTIANIGCMTDPAAVACRLAAPSDATMLVAFAARTFRDAFGADNRPEDIESHVAGAFGIQRQSDELADGAVVTLLAECDSLPVAYAQLRIGSAPKGLDGQGTIELWRFYVDRAWHGHGLAQRLMAAVIEQSLARDARRLWLGVWERNSRAIGFYRKCGFEKLGEQEFVLGTDPQVDWVMVRTLPEPANRASP